MPSRAELEQQSALQSSIVAMAWEQVLLGWAELDLDSSSITTQSAVVAVTELLADIVEVWGDAAGTVAADFYDGMREESGAPGTFKAILADAADRDQLAGGVRWALDPWAQAVTTGGGFDPVTGEALPSDRRLPEELDIELMLGKLEGPMQRLVRHTGRATIDQSARVDPARPRVARVPMGAETCAFCLVLASRGPVYRSTATAGHDTKYHNFCDCEQIIVWTRDDKLPEGYDPGELYGKYESARREAGSSDLRKILKQLRLQEGIR